MNMKNTIILYNGKIFTSAATQLYVQALASKGNKILRIGSRTGGAGIKSPGAERSCKDSV